MDINTGLLKQIGTLIRKDFILELRQKHTLYGILLYVSCTAFLIYMMSGQPESRVWNALFWIAQLFITVNSVAKSFLQEGEGRARYYFTLVRPAHYLAAKMIYSAGLMLLVTLLSLGLFGLLLGNPAQNGWVFLLIAITGGVSLSVLFTFLSAIAAQARQNAALMAILGFPIAIPLLMILSKLSLAVVASVAQEGWSGLLLVLLGLDVMIVVLGLILFQFLWKE